MKISAFVIIICATIACVSRDIYDDTLPDNQQSDEYSNETNTLENFVRIETSGTYTYVASPTNNESGETVDIVKEYYICRYAVTNSEWKTFIEDTKIAAPKYWKNGNIPEGKENHPVVWVSYNVALQYCQWLSDKTESWIFRLPTAQEWEYAAIGKERQHYPWGENAETKYSDGSLSSKFNYNGVIAAQVLETPEKIAIYNNMKSTRYGEQDMLSDIITISATGGVKGWVNHKDYLGFIYTDIFTEINNCGGNTCAVNAYPEGKSWCGCYNMSGNCWEWTSTIEFAQNGAEKGQEVNVIKGGSWYATSSSCKASFRGEGRKASSAYNTVGLRIVAERKL